MTGEPVYPADEAAGLLVSRGDQDMQREIKMGTVSWINDQPNPMYSTLQAVTLSPDWIPKTYLGLSATSNPAPPESLPDFLAYQRTKHFRAMTYCHFHVEIDDRTGQVTSFRVADAFSDGGWTPPFRIRQWPSTIFSFDMSIYDTNWYRGESSPLSFVRRQARHPNTAISSVSGDETVLVNSLIKFRAGQHTDDVGIKKVGAPFHVPWVWCEMVLTHVGGQFKAYGRGSIFPSHAWYLDGRRIQTQGQVADTSFPVTMHHYPPRHIPVPVPRISIPSLTIATGALRIYPVLSKGAPAHGPQTRLSDDTHRTGSVETHPYTVGGGETLSTVAGSAQQPARSSR